MPWKINKHILYTLISAAFIIVGTLAAINYAKGNYRLTDTGFVRESGLLSANSFPTGAEIFIDGKLVSASDDTLYLEPGEYEVKIIKDGFSPWKKLIQIEKELVTQTNAQLFPTSPSLVPLTFTGVQNISISPDGQKLVYYAASASAETKNGLYLLELGNSFFSLQKGPKQLAEDSSSYDLSRADFIWSPDSTELMMIDSNRQIMIDITKKNVLANLPDVGVRSKQIFSLWEEEIYLRERQLLDKFPPEIIRIATQSAHNVYLSPSKKRLLYTSSQDVGLGDELIPPVLAASTQNQERQLQTGGIYIYDLEEDRNFRIDSEPEDASEDTKASLSIKSLLSIDLYNREPLSLEASPSAFRRLQDDSLESTVTNFSNYYSSLNLYTPQWFPDSSHVLFIRDESIRIKEYDNSNETIIYSGPFQPDFVYSWPDGSKLLILTSFSPGSPVNLYAIELK